MATRTRGREPGRRQVADAEAPTHRYTDGIRLTVGQQEYLSLHGFGPGAPTTDFGDPEVRARFVQLLRDCGALTPAAAPRPRVSRSRRHLRRTG
jgi:hypothetical protein